MNKLSILLLALTVGALACSDDKMNPQLPDTVDNQDDMDDPTPEPDPEPEADPEPVYMQVERLARPAINEGLFFTEAYLNAVNSIGPGDEPDALVGDIAAQAVAVIDAVDAADGSDDSDATAIIGALVPDVMRIDTTVSSPVGTYAYNSAFNDVLSPVGGRKIEDDVMDITLSILLNLDVTGSSIGDNVSYAGEPGNPATGHSLLHGQSEYGGAATFPFLAAPN